MNYDELALNQWNEIVKGCRGHVYRGEQMAAECFLMISDFKEYGYLTDEFKKNQIRREFLKLYKDKLTENNNSIGLTNVKNRQIGSQ